MRKISLLFIIILFAIPYSVAQDKQPVNIDHPVYHALRENEQIDCVKTDKKATTLYFCAKGDSGTWEKFLSCSYLIDEKGKRHKIVGTKNIQLDKKTYLGKKHQLNFRVAFEPLPVGTKRFDLITDAYINGGGAYYGIREKGTSLIDPNAIDTLGTHRDVEKFFPDSIFKEDSVSISGQIENLDALKKDTVKLYLYLMRNYQNDTNFEASKFHIIVDSCGNFNVRLPIIGPYYTQMHLWTNYPNSFIPVMLYPGDHLKIRICDLGKDTQHVIYDSERGDFNNFLNHCPVFYSPSNINYIGNKDSVDAPWAMDAVIKHVNEMDSLTQYIANKYAMSKAETQLLRTETNVNTVANFIYYLNSVISKRYYKKTNQLRNGYTTELLDSLQEIATNPCYRALSLLHADDNTFMMADSYHFLFYSLFMSRISDVIGLKQLFIENFKNKDDSIYERLILNSDSLFTDFICSFREKKPNADKLFKQSFLLNYFIRGSQTLLYNGTSPKDVYRKLAAKKSSQITLPVLQGLLKVAQRNFIER
jgi:hypothetical protein